MDEWTDGLVINLQHSWPISTSGPLLASQMNEWVVVVWTTSSTMYKYTSRGRCCMKFGNNYNYNSRDSCWFLSNLLVVQPIDWLIDWFERESQWTRLNWPEICEKGQLTRLDLTALRHGGWDGILDHVYLSIQLESSLEQFDGWHFSLRLIQLDSTRPHQHRWVFCHRESSWN